MQKVNEQHELFYFGEQVKPSLLLPCLLNLDDGNTSCVGLIDTRSKNVIFHSFYAKIHIAPHCQLKLFQLDQVVKKNDVLTADERATVPDTSYKNVKAYFASTETNTKEIETKHDIDWKNSQGVC